MDSKSVERKNNIDKNILDLFWNLCEKSADIRLHACAHILQVIWKKQRELENENELCTEVQYCIERLVKGLASPRDAARLGYTLLLTEILKQINVVQIEEVLELMKKHLTITGKQDKRDLVFGQLFAYTAIVRSGRLPNHPYLSYVILSLYELSLGKHYILNATYEIILDVFSQISSDNFKDIWPQLKKKLPTDWQTSSADSLWLLFLCIRLFPDTGSAKYLKKHWGTDDLFSPENLNNVKKLMKQTTSSLPNLHPLCFEFILLAKQRKDFSEVWNSVVDENLFDHEQTEKAFVGFEMIKGALQDVPTKKTLKIVMSSKFRNVFLKHFLNVKSSMNPAANRMADFLCNFVKTCGVPEMQINILKTFLQLPGTVTLDQILRKKEVSVIIQNLLPDAVKALCDILITLLLKSKSTIDDGKLNNMKRCQAVQQIANLVAHPVMLADVDWRLDVIRFLFLYSFFTVNEPTSEIVHCDKISEPLSDNVRDACTTAFFKSVNSLHVRTEKHHSSLSSFLEQLQLLTEYAEKLMGASGNVEPNFPIEKIQDSWKHLKSIVHKLSKQSKKDGLVNESNAFQALFLQLGFHLFQDPDSIPEVLEELHICCKKSLKSRKQEAANNEDEENEPPWIGVVVDILLSLLSKSSNHLRSLVTYVFPLFCPFIDANALQQILDVVNPQNSDENMIVDESEDEEEQDIDFGSGSSSDESEEETDNQPVDEEFKKKVQEALGPAADNSDAESVVLSDSEMFKLDSALSEAFKSRKKSGHTQMKSEEKTLLHFRVRCFDLILSYLKSEPPMHLALKCLEPVLAAYEFGHHSKHQSPLLTKAVTVLQFITKMKKFQNHDDVNKSELKRLLDILIPKCHKEINITVSQKLSSLCVFIVLCYRKLENTASSDKKKTKTPFYIKTYLSALDTFVSSGSSHMLPNFFTHLMEACPELAWNFIEPCKNYAFNNSTRLFKRTQCLGLLSESLKYSKSQKEITHDQWLDLANEILPLGIEVLKNAFESSDIKPVYSTELLNVIYTLHSVVKEKTDQSVLEKYSDFLPLLTNANKGKMQKLSKKGRSLRNKIVICLGGNLNQSKKSEVEIEENGETGETNKRKLEESSEVATVNVNGDVKSPAKKKLKKKNKKTLEITNNNTDGLSDENNLVCK